MSYHAISDTIHPYSTITAPAPFDISRINLGISGVLGFIAGDVATFVMASIPIYERLEWAGWYNTAGSYQIAKQYSLASKSPLLKELFPGSNLGALQLVGQLGPRFQATRSGTVMDSTGRLASILMQQCASKQPCKVISRRDGQGFTVSVVDLRPLREVPRKEIDIPRIHIRFPFLSIIPIAASFFACLGSAFCSDWTSSSLILLGMFINGISYLIIGTGTLHFTHHIPSAGCPPGDGILGSGNDLVVLRGEEGAVNCVTVGKLALKFPDNVGDNRVRLCSILFATQFIAQLFLIPQASVCGQIMFIFSLAVSYVFNRWFASSNDEGTQRQALLDGVFGSDKSFLKYSFGTRTSAVIFALSVLLHDDLRGVRNSVHEPHSTGAQSNPEIAESIISVDSTTASASSDVTLDDQECSLREAAGQILDAYLPHNTRAWKIWKKNILTQLCKEGMLCTDKNVWNGIGSPNDKVLVETLCRDAVEAWNAYSSAYNSLDK